MIVADESSEDSHDNHEHVRGVLESMGLDPDADGYEADSDTSPSSPQTVEAWDHWWSEQEGRSLNEDDEESDPSSDTFADLPALEEIPPDEPEQNDRIILPVGPNFQPIPPYIDGMPVMEWIRENHQEFLDDVREALAPYIPSEDGYSTASDAPTNNTLEPPWTSMMRGAETLMMDMENGEVPGATQEFLYAEGRPYYQVPQRDLTWLDTPQRRFVQDVTSLHKPPICVLVDGSSDHEFYYDDHLMSRKCGYPLHLAVTKVCLLLVIQN